MPTAHAREDVARVRDFDRAMHEQAAERRVSHRFGTAIFHDDFPAVWDLH